ncbi:MAG: XdhC family protein [Saprospiraceae bacterium]
MSIWEFIHDMLSTSQKVMLMVVVESEGSSPGRQGFKMAVAEDGSTCGTIGGGIMEHKLVEKAKISLQQEVSSVELMHQFHDKKQAKNQSGMICSGSQLNAFIPLSNDNDSVTVSKILQNPFINIQFSNNGIELTESSKKGLEYTSGKEWSYFEKSSSKPVIHIIGGGHVGLALSELMSFLEFYIKIYDDRPDVQTLLDNTFAHEKIIVPSYDLINNYIQNAQDDYIVIMTVGYRTDKIILRKLWDTTCAYMGMLGSDYKVNTLLAELKEESYDAYKLLHLFAPIGITIFSKTSQEIAVSIAAEIIREKNKNLSTGRHLNDNLD